MTATAVASTKALSPARWRSASIPILGAAILLAIWQLAGAAGLTAQGLLATPTAIIAELVSSPMVYLNATAATLGVAAIGYVIGQVLAIALALLFVRLPIAEKLLLQLALAVVCVPLVAIMPILQIAFDVTTTKITLAAMSVFFPTLIATIVGLRSADPNVVTVMRAWGASEGQILRDARLPSALPGIFTGLQVGVPAALLGTILGEFSGSSEGIGTLIVTGLFKMNVTMTWTVAVIATIITTALYALIGYLARRVVPWADGISAAARVTGAVRSIPRRFFSALGWTVASIAVILLAWWAFIALFDLSPFFAKTPVDVFEWLVTSPDAAAHRALLLEPTAVTLTHAVVGYAAGLVVGLLAAALFTALPWLEQMLLPLTLTLRSVPLPVLLPIIVIAFGRDLTAVAVLCAIVTFFPTLANVSTGLARTPKDALLLFRSYDSSTTKTFLLARFPFAMPSVLASARIAAPSALLAATLAEWLATGDGLGNLMVTARASQEFIVLWSTAAVLTALAVGFYLLVSALESVVLRRFGSA